MTDVAGMSFINIVTGLSDKAISPNPFAFARAFLNSNILCRMTTAWLAMLVSASLTLGQAFQALTALSLTLPPSKAGVQVSTGACHCTCQQLHTALGTVPSDAKSVCTCLSPRPSSERMYTMIMIK